MFKKKIILATDNGLISESLAKIFVANFEAEHFILNLSTYKAVIGEIETTDQQGDDIVLAVIDDNLLAGTEAFDAYKIVSLIKERNRRTPIIVLTAFSELDVARKPLDALVSLYIHKPFEDNYLLAGSRILIRDYEGATRKSLRVDENTIIKVAETAFELKLWGQLRYRVYVEEDQLIKSSKLKNELHARREEWDDYDRLTSTKQIIVMRFDQLDGTVTPICVGGSRQMVGVLAMDKVFYLNDYRKRGIVPRQVCRFIIDKSERGKKTFFLELLRYLFDVFREYPIAFCTSRDHQVSLFEKIGFVAIGNAIESEQYGLDGRWTPMILDPAAIWQSHIDGTLQAHYPKLNELMFNLITSTILGPDDRMRLGSMRHTELEDK